MLEDEERLRSFVGVRANWYIERWRRITEEKRSLGFNWAALFLSIFWLIYRGMYRNAWIAFGVAVLYALFSEFALAPNLSPEDLRMTERLWGLLLGVTFGRFGNVWYLNHARRMIATHAPETAEAVAKLGGVRLMQAVLVGIGIFSLGVITAAME